MSFSPEWLALREPADFDARNPEVAAALRNHFAERAHLRVIDLGCGAGSNLRGLSQHLGNDQHWTLVDYDAKLLEAARAELMRWADTAKTEGAALVLTHGGQRLEVEFKQADLSSGDLSALFSGADLITAAALFDLVSVARIEAVAEAIAAKRQAFMTVLTYDGHAAWTPTHPADCAMRDAFNAHQKSDKGFGPAAGPGGTTALAKAFYKRGYRVLRGTSPWVVDERYGVLRGELDKGFAGAVRETGSVPTTTIAAWLALRQQSNDGVSIVGHEDILVLPAV
jgi:SAM-dependent methyltransferase